MLEQVMQHTRNYFIREYHMGQFSIHDGMLFPHDFLLDGQRFYITGSNFSDGVYTFYSGGIKNDDDSVEISLPDETFTGIVYALAVPPTFIALVGEIEEWVGKFGEAASNPYQGETFNGYSYTKAINYSSSDNGGGSPTWQSTFRNRLNKWRKVSVL